MPEPIRPSETEKFTQCPMKWLYEDVQGWRRPHAPFSPEMLMGTALHAGMAAYWRHQGDGEHTYPQNAADEALSQGWPKSTDVPIEGIADLLQKVLEKAMRWCETDIPLASPLLIEQPLDATGHTTPDLVTRENGHVVVTDWKYHHEVKPENLHYRLEGDERKHQFHDYIWRVGEYLKEPVRLFRVVHIVGLPKVIVRENTFVPNEQAQAAWLAQAKRKWYQMGQIKIDPALAWRNENGCLQFGQKWPCSMMTACWECHGNQEQMAQFYVKEPQDV